MIVHILVIVQNGCYFIIILKRKSYLISLNYVHNTSLIDYERYEGTMYIYQFKVHPPPVMKKKTLKCYRNICNGIC